MDVALFEPQIIQIDPNANYAVNTFEYHGQVYSFGDATGLVRDASIGVGHYVEDIDAGCPRLTWGNLTWDAEFPEGGLIQMSIALANERDKLGDADWITIAVAPMMSVLDRFSKDSILSVKNRVDS